MLLPLLVLVLVLVLLLALLLALVLLVLFPVLVVALLLFGGVRSDYDVTHPHPDHLNHPAMCRTPSRSRRP